MSISHYLSMPLTLSEPLGGDLGWCFCLAKALQPAPGALEAAACAPCPRRALSSWLLLGQLPRAMLLGGAAATTPLVPTAITPAVPGEQC